MASSIQLLRSTNAQERPFPGNLLEGQPAVNLNSTEPGLFFKAADGSLVKFGPAAITSDGSPPNSSPQGSSGNTVGELWLDKSTDPAVLKVYDGTDWIDAGSGGGGGAGSFVRWIYTAIGGETSLSGSSGGVLLDYTPGLEEVFVNGVLITRGTDYSATNGSSITNLSPLTAGDVVTVTSMNPLEVVQLPGQVTLLRWTVLASAGQTVLSGIDSSSQQLAYTAGFEEVYVNGAFLRRGLDYTATNGSSITLTSPLALDDEVTVMAWSPIEIGSLSVDTEDIVDEAVTTAKIDNEAVTTAKIDDEAVTTAKIDDEAVTTAKIGNNAVTDAKVSPTAAISTDKLSFLSDITNNTQIRDLTGKLSDSVSVRDFGAVGDGITDDTIAFNETISAAQKNGRAIYVPGGRYKITQGMVLRPSQPNSAAWPEQAGVSVVMYGDGPYASIIEWGGTTPMTEFRFAMLNVAGRSLLRDISFVCPRTYRNQRPGDGYENVRTPYYGCVISSVAWNSTFINVQFKYFHVPFSLGVIKKYRWGPGIIADYEPGAGTSRPGTAIRDLYNDIAQNTYINCQFVALTDEWLDGTFDPDTTLNANGTLLFRGSGDVNSPENPNTTFTDGTFAAEIGKPQSVNNNFVGCTFVNANPASLGLIRLTSGADTEFIGCGLFAQYDPRFPSNVPTGRPAFFEYSTSQGTSTRVHNCYFISGIVQSTGANNSLMTIRDCSGEGGIRNGCDFIGGVNGGNYSQQLIFENMTFGKFACPAPDRPLVLYNKGKSNTATSWGITVGRPRLIIKNLIQPGPILINDSTWTKTPGKAVSVVPDLAASLRNSADQPEDLPAYVYDPVAARVGWDTRAVRSGRWFLMANPSTANSIRPIFPIDAQSVYNISFDVWVKFKSGKGPGDLTNELGIAVFYRSGSGQIGQELTQFFGISPASFRLGALGEGVTTHIANQVSPPTSAISCEFRIVSDISASTAVDEIGVGSFKMWDTLSEDCDLFTVNP